MQPTNEWFYFTDIIDKATCKKIINVAGNVWQGTEVNVNKAISEEERKTGRVLQNESNPKIRISNIHWTREQWMYDLIWPYMVTANQDAGWRYAIKSAETMQITRYKKGGHYDFHYDGCGDHLSAYSEPGNIFMDGPVRKLSMTLLLNDNYEGGEFQFTSYAKEKCKISTPEFNNVGSIIVFPSYIEHRVAPVTKGFRYSLVTWFLGPPFV